MHLIRRMREDHLLLLTWDQKTVYTRLDQNIFLCCDKLRQPHQIILPA